MAAHEWNRKTWLEKHPNDQWIDDENMQSRQRGHDKDGIRALMAAICFRAVEDYKEYCIGMNPNREPRSKAAVECKEFFDSDVFKYFTNGMSSDEVAKHIRGIKGRVYMRTESAKNTRPIIEEQCDEQGS